MDYDTLFITIFKRRFLKGVNYQSINILIIVLLLTPPAGENRGFIPVHSPYNQPGFTPAGLAPTIKLHLIFTNLRTKG